MAKSFGQKTKLLLLLELFRESSDEDHALSTAELLNALEEQEIHCDRKTLYSDIACLNDYGFDIVTEAKRNGGGFKMLSREFELAELKLLVDAVQSSKFITIAKSKTLIEKIGRLTSRYHAKELNRQVYVTNRAKTVNENILYSVDAIQQAMRENSRIRFSYLEWTLEKKLEIRGEKVREASPWALLYDDKNYYLLAFDHSDRKRKHFRVDKMDHVSVTDVAREGGDQYSAIDLGEYAGESFGMFGGKRELVTMEFENRLVGVAIDRFGTDLDIRQLDNGRFRIRREVIVSGQFFGWLAGIGSGARIVAPSAVLNQYCNYLQQILETQKEDALP